MFQIAYSGATRFNDSYNVLFPRYNMTLLPVIGSCVNNDCRVFFLPYVKEDRVFDWRRFDQNDKLFMIRFDSFLSKAKEYLRNNAIDFFVVDRMTRGDLWLHAILQACKVTGTKAIYLEHGETGSIHPDIEFDRILNYDYFYASNTDMKRHMQKQVQKYYTVSKCIIREWNRPKILPKKQSKVHRILYAPQFIEADRFNQLFPQTLQYKHRERLVKEFDILQDETGVSTIWKTFKSGNLLYDPIKDICKDYQVEYVDDDSFNWCLSRSSMVITDCISTTIYDAIDYGLPVLCLRYSKAAPIRESILKEFGNSIFIYDYIDQAVERIIHFVAACLGDNESNYIPIIERKPDKFPWENLI